MRTPIELLTLGYFLVYVPYAVLTRWMASIDYPPLGRPLTGLEILPAATILCGILTFLFAWLSGWARQAHRIRLFGHSWPCPTRWTLLSGIGTALLLFTVPLSFTFKGVSIPFMQLMMRGDVLIIAPLVDLLCGRKVRWYSWVALLVVAVGLALTIHARGGLYLPPLAIVTVVLYTVGYFVRLWVMTSVSKTGEPDSVKAYFVEEKLVAIPFSVLCLAALSVINFGTQRGELSFGFGQVWTSNQMFEILALAMMLFVISVFSILILLDKRENTYCVPFERAASILSGIAAAYFLAANSMGEFPTGAEVMAAALLIGAIVLLSVASHWGRRR